MIESLLKKSNKIALVDEKFGKISYLELKRESEKITKLIKTSCIALLIADNNFEFLRGYLGFLKNKKTISIILDISLSDTFLKKIFSIYEPNYIFCPKFKNYIFSNCRKHYESDDYNILRSKFKFNKKLNFKNFLLLPTSGTTQSPKLVRLSEMNIKDNIKKIKNYLSINKKNNTTITTMPLGYSYGLSIVHTHLYAEGKIVLNKKSIFEKGFWELVKKNKVNSLNGVPEFYEYLKKINFEKRFQKSIKYLTQAGGKINEETLSYFGKICKKKNIKFIVMYGQTETSPRMTYLKWKDFFTKFKSIGKPLSGYKIKLVSENRKVIKEKMKIGEIYFHGRNVCLGYSSSKKDLEKGDENNGKIFTGDLAYRDEDNFLFIVGRNNRTIKFFGKRLNLDDIERYFLQKKISVKCKFQNSRIVLFVNRNFKENLEVNSLSNFLQINKNFILVKQKMNSFKDYKNA